MKVQLFFVISALLFVGRPADACDCVQQTVEEARDWADFVFAGAITQIKWSYDTAGERTTAILTIQVADVWKGAMRRTAIVHIPYADMACGGDAIQEGERLLVYSQLQAGRKFSNAYLCRRTGLLRAVSSSEWNILGKSKFPPK